MSELPALYSLPEAARLLSSRGTKIGVGSLRSAVERSQLQVTRIGGRVLVTELQLQEMINRCQPSEKAPGSTSESEKAENPSGSSEMDRKKSAQVAAMAQIKRLKNRSQTTSHGNTSQRGARAN